jgi:hypothetical protein
MAFQLQRDEANDNKYCARPAGLAAHSEKGVSWGNRAPNRVHFNHRRQLRAPVADLLQCSGDGHPAESSP